MPVIAMLYVISCHKRWCYKGIRIYIINKPQLRLCKILECWISNKIYHVCMYMCHCLIIWYYLHMLNSSGKYHAFILVIILNSTLHDIPFESLLLWWNQLRMISSYNIKNTQLSFYCVEFMIEYPQVCLYESRSHAIWIEITCIKTYL